MVGVQDRTVDAAPAPPRRDWAPVWLTLAIAALALIGVVPWERWCSFGGDGFPVVCFDAPIWSGSASLFGLIALIASAVFVVLALLRRRPLSTRLSALAISFAAIALIAAVVKLTVVQTDAVTYSTETSGAPGRVFAGTWLGLCLSILGGLLLVMVLARHPVRRTPIVCSLVVAGVLIGLAIPYTRAGLAWWGGPLAPPSRLGGAGVGQGFGVAPGTIFLGGVLNVGNSGRVAVTIDGIDAVGRFPMFGFGPQFVAPDRCYAPSEAPSGPPACAVPLHGYRVEPGALGGIDVGAVVRIPWPGPYRVGWFRIRYHVGPFHFEAFETEQLTICGLTPGREDCPRSP